LTRDGKCVRCPYGEVLSDDKKSCSAAGTCNDRYILTDGPYGKCVACPDGQILTKDKKSCEVPKCDSIREKIDNDGKCITCPNYEVPSADKKKCA